MIDDRNYRGGLGVWMLSSVGKDMKKVLPIPSLVSNQIAPLAFSTMPLQIARPRPVPDDLVVKLGVNILFCISLGMPLPLSATAITT